MHNLLLGTAKYMLNLWKEVGLLTPDQLELIQNKIDCMQVPPHVGRIPTKIYVNATSLTADQWRNWTCIYSLYALKEILPGDHYNCWVLFCQACIVLLQPVIHDSELHEADEKLVRFCKTFQNLYGAHKCTPNMHLHCHIRETIVDYGPVYSTWCFAFERFNGILQSFQKSWIHPEIQLLSKFLNFQNVLAAEFPFSLPLDVVDILHLQSSKVREVTIGQGSLLDTHVDSGFLHEYSRNSSCKLSSINTTETAFHKLPAQHYEQYLSPEDMSCIQEVYHEVYTSRQLLHIPMSCEVFYEIEVLGEKLVSSKCKGEASPYVLAQWAGLGGQLSQDTLRVGKILCFVRHFLALDAPEAGCQASKHFKTSHIFAKVQWHGRHPKESWLPPPVLVVAADCEPYGPASFIPISRIKS